MIAKTPIRAASIVPVTPSRVAGFLDFGSQNRFPQDLIKMVSGSITAGSCIKRRAQFISGNGFNRVDLSKLVVNRQRQTLDAVLRRTGWNVGFFECPALHIQYNGLGQTAGIRPIPVENVRLGKPDDFENINTAGIFPYLDSTVFKNRDKRNSKLTLFNPEIDVVRKEIEVAGGIDKYQGQILYLPMLSPGDYYYHFPDWFKAHTAIETEKELNIFDLKQTTNSFAISGFASYLAEENTNDTDADELGSVNYRSGRDVDTDSIEYQYQQSIGNREAGSVVFNRFSTKEAMDSFKFEPVTGAQMSERNGSVNQRVPENICRSFEVPPSRVGLTRPSGLVSTGDMLREDVNNMYQSVNDYQRLIKEAFESVLNHWHTPLGEIDLAIDPLDYFNEKKNVPVSGK